MPDDYHGVLWVDIDQIDDRLRPASLVRAALDREAVERYRAVLKDLPPVKLTYDREADTHWVDDGAHTITASIAEGRKQIPVLVRTGTFVESFAAAAHANETHGVPKREADKRHAVEQFLRHVPGAMDMIQEEIADICNVAQQYVSRIMCSLTTGGKASPSPDDIHLTPAERKVKEAYDANPDASIPEIAKLTGVSGRTIVKARAKLGLSRASPSGQARVVPLRLAHSPVDDIFISDVEWEPLGAILEGAIAKWPRNEWGAFVVHCLDWASRKAREIGLTIEEDIRHHG